MMIAQPNNGFPAEIWEKIGYNLTEHPPSLCLLAKTSPNLRSLVNFVVGHYEAHLHISFPNDQCCEEENSSKEKVEFEMILNRKSKYRREKAHCHSKFNCNIEKVNEALDDILEIFADEIISLRFNNVPETRSSCFTVFNKYNLEKCDNINFDGSLPTNNGIFDLFQSCPNLNRLIINDPPENTDFSNFWSKLKGLKHLESLDLMDIEHFDLSSAKEFKLPPSLKKLFFCPKSDKICKDAKNLSKVLYSANWERVYIHSDSVLNDVISGLYKPLKSINEFCFSSTVFALNYVIKFMKKCENVKYFNWYGLHCCVAPIVISKFLNDLPSKRIVFGGCVACKSGQTVGNGGFMEVGNRVDVIKITNLLQRAEFKECYGNILEDIMLFERPYNSSTIMYIQKKDSQCGPNCLDIHEISQKAGIDL